MEKPVMKENNSSPSIVSNTVESLSNRFFPTIDFNELARNSDEIGCQVTSSLALQVIIHFSAFYFPPWLLATASILYVKFRYLSMIYRYVVIAVYTALPPLELVRLYLAYAGNIHEKVPELAGSWLVGCLLQLPLLLFVMLAPGCLPTPPDYTLHGVYLILLLLHLMTARTAIVNMAAQQARIYHDQHDYYIRNRNARRYET